MSKLFNFVVKSKFALEDGISLVLERDGSLVDTEFEMIKHISACKETLMVLTNGSCWENSAAVQVSMQVD